MKQYNFTINCGNSILNGTNVSTKAEVESDARDQVLTRIKRATKDIGLDSLELVGTGKLTPAQLLGSAGGKKSKRTITPDQQRKMQEARKNSKQNA